MGGRRAAEESDFGSLSLLAARASYRPALDLSWAYMLGLELYTKNEKHPDFNMFGRRSEGIATPS